MRTLTTATNVTCVHEEWVKCNNKTIFFLFLLSNSHLRYSREEEPTRNEQKCQNNHPKSASQPPKNTFIDLTTHILKGREASELYTFREISARRKIYRLLCARSLNRNKVKFFYDVSTLPSPFTPKMLLLLLFSFFFLYIWIQNNRKGKRELQQQFVSRFHKLH